MTCEAPGDTYLLLDWLNALIYEMAVRRVVFGRFTVSIEGNRLVGQAWGEPVNRKRHRPAVEPKGATLTALKVKVRDDGDLGRAMRRRCLSKRKSRWTYRDYIVCRTGNGELTPKARCAYPLYFTVPRG